MNAHVHWNEWVTQCTYKWTKYYHYWADECENCGVRADLHCQQCSESYCRGCSSVRHRHPARKAHHLVRLSALGAGVKQTPQCAQQPGAAASIGKKVTFPLDLYMVEPNSFSDAYPIRSFPTVELHEMQMTGILVKQFGLTAFRDWQLEIIQAVLARKNTFVLQPTGSGKSLCFQFPPLVTKKMTVVLTPTIALMND